MKVKECCPKCKSEKLVVYWMNGKSYCNDYYCRNCGEVFSFSKTNNKYYKLSEKRIKQLKEFN